MEDLTQRQIEILKTIIIEYSQTGEPVGSEILDKKYNLGVSPATVRNEMVELAKKEYIKKQHFSSGRIPTAKAFRFYINNLMDEKELSTADEVAFKSDIWDYRSEIHHLLQQATRVLADRTKLLALTTTDSGNVYYHGIQNLFQHKEFWDIDLMTEFFERFDELSFFQGILREFNRIEEDILFMLGDERLKGPNVGPYAGVYCEFSGKGVKGAIGVIGPKRMPYETVIPNVKYFTSLLDRVIQEQGL